MKNKKGEWVWNSSDGQTTYKFVGFGQLLNSNKVEGNYMKTFTDPNEIREILNQLQGR